MLAFAHRGGAYHPEIEGLENTLAAFKHAVALGYDYLETDVHVTSDGVLLAFHDTVLDRVTDVEGAIADLTFEEVRRALVGGREQVPTLAQLFDEFPRARFNIDLKSDGAVAALAGFVGGARGLGPRAGRLVQPPAARGFRRLTGHRVPTSASPVEVAVFRFVPSARRRGLAHPHGGSAALQIPHRRGRLDLATPGWYAGRTRPASTCTSGPSTTPRRWSELLDRGVDGLFTDRTDLLKDVLAERGHWKD